MTPPPTPPHGIVPVAVDRIDCYQVLEALGHASELAASLRAYGAQVEFEDAFGLLRDALFPDLPNGLARLSR